MSIKSEMFDALTKDIAFRDWVADSVIKTYLGHEEGCKALKSMLILYRAGISPSTLANMNIESIKLDHGKDS